MKKLILKIPLQINKNKNIKFGFLVMMLFVNFKGFTQSVNCANNSGITVTVTATSSASYLSARNRCLPGEIITGTPNVAWTGLFSGGTLTYTFSRPLTSARISYSTIDGPVINNSQADTGQVSIDGGGVLTLTDPCMVTVAGNILTSSLPIAAQTPNFSNAAITVTSTCPFTQITITEMVNESGWVQGNPCAFILTPYVCNEPAPVLSATSLDIVCPNTTADLTTITTDLRCNSVLTWHTGIPATAANTVTNPSEVLPGTYYASVFNSFTNCYSATTPVVVAIGDCCPPTLTLVAGPDDMSNNSPVAVKWRKTSNWIKATNIVSVGNANLGDGVIYRADNFVELNPGFEAVSGAQFSAFIQRCDGNNDFVYKTENNDDVEVEDNAKSLVQKLNIYPNPTNNYITVDYNVGFNQVKITSIEGKTVFNQKTAVSNSKQLDVTNLKNGIYTLSIITVNGDMLTQKLIKN